MLESKWFTTLKEAKEFLKNVKGHYDGPFYDYDGNTSYVVYYRVKTMENI